MAVRHDIVKWLSSEQHFSYILDKNNFTKQKHIGKTVALECVYGWKEINERSENVVLSTQLLLILDCCKFSVTCKERGISQSRDIYFRPVIRVSCVFDSCCTTMGSYAAAKKLDHVCIRRNALW